MRLSSRLGLAGVGLLCAGYAAAFAAGCSSKTTSSGGTSGDTCANAANKCVVPPPAPTGATTVTASHNYAVHTLYLGDTDRTGVSSTTAWEAFGYNLDDLVTTSTSTDVCTLAAGAAKSTQVDGNGGIDNSFGSQIMPIVITAAGSNASSEINTAIQEGHFTIMTYVTGFDDTSGSTANGTGLTGLLLAGGDYSSYFDGGAPAWNTTTNWPIVPTLMNGCSANTGCGTGCTYGSSSCGVNPLTAATVTFPSAYQADGTFVNGSAATLSLNLSIGGQSLAINVHSATITFQPGTTAGTVTNGTIAGALLTTELISSLQGVAGHISTSLCQGSAFEAIEQEIQQASDIVISSSGSVTNGPGQACNAISIGLGFDADEIAAPTASDIEAPAAAVANPCDAGSD